MKAYYPTATILRVHFEYTKDQYRIAKNVDVKLRLPKQVVLRGISVREYYELVRHRNQILRAGKSEFRIDLERARDIFAERGMDTSRLEAMLDTD